MSSPILRVVTQRSIADCGVAVLAMLAGVTYEEALVALSHEEPSVLDGGVYAKHLERAAAQLGLTLKRRKKYDLDDATGILNVSCPTWPSDHVVILREGLIVETDGTLWEADVFLQHHGAKPGLLLVEA